MIKNENGNVFIISTFFVVGILVIFLFIIMIFISEINSLLYNIKIDMYSINKSAIISVNKGITGREKFSYDEETYLDYFKKMLMENYNLNDELKNNEGLIKKVTLLEYEIYQKGKKDKYTNIRVNDTTIHSVIKVEIKPIILEDFLQDIFTFEIHEDVVLNKVNV